MEILGIGPLELNFILLIALIVLGPGDMVKTGRTIGRFFKKNCYFLEWHTIQKTSRELHSLYNRFTREAALEDLSKDLTDLNKVGNAISQDLKSVENDLSSWVTPPQLNNSIPEQPELHLSPATKPDILSSKDTTDSNT